MVRTKASANTVRVSAAKAPRKYSAPVCHSSSVSSSPAGNKKDKSVGGNSVCPRPTPDWQKSIGTFFTVLPREKGKEDSPPPQETKDVGPESNASPVEHPHDNKENLNPQENNIDEPMKEDEPGPSTSHSSKGSSKRRILRMVDSESEEEDSSSQGCVIRMEDEITAC